MINYDYWRGQGGDGTRPMPRGGYYESPAPALPGGDYTAGIQPTGNPTPAGHTIGGVINPPGGYNMGMPQADYTGGQMGYGNFNFPALWGDVGNFYSNLMGGGMNVGMPPIFGAAQNRMIDMMKTGEPIDITGWINSQMPMIKRATEQNAFDIYEGAGIAGTRAGSGTQRQVANANEMMYENMAAQAAQLQLQAEEAAKSRILQAAGLAPSMSNAYASTQFGNIANQMAGAQGAYNLGYQQMFAPAQLAQMMMGMGNQYMGAEQGMYNNMYNDPYLLAALGAFGQGSQYMPQQYTPGWGTQMMNAGSSMWPYLMYNWGSGNAPSGQAYGYP